VYLCQLFSFRNLFVNLLGEVLVGLENLDVGHYGVFDWGRAGKGYDENLDVAEGEDSWRVVVWMVLMEFEALG
jgi:hypothetical protein